MTIDELDLRTSQETHSQLKRHHYIDGAPFMIGDYVKVLDNPNGDTTFDLRFVGQHGFVKYFEYDCGSGQTFPTDPMIGVKFEGGQIEEFWKEELVLTT